MMFARSISEDMLRANSVTSGQKNASPSGRNSMYLSSSLLHPLRMSHTRGACASNLNTCISRQMSKLFLHDSISLSDAEPAEDFVEDVGRSVFAGDFSERGDCGMEIDR